MKGLRTYSSSQARAQWRDVLDLAAGGTDVVIERHGKPIAAMIAYADYYCIREENGYVDKQIARAGIPPPEGDGVDDEYY